MKIGYRTVSGSTSPYTLYCVATRTCNFQLNVTIWLHCLSYYVIPKCTLIRWDDKNDNYMKTFNLFCLLTHGNRHETLGHARMDMPLCLICVCV